MMKAAVLYGPSDVKLEDIPIPEINENEVLVNIKAGLTCGTDRKVYLRGGHPTMIKPPATFGHEFSGIVAKVGKNVRRFKEGERVVAANSAPCGKCFWCKSGRFSSCEDILYINGAYAEYTKIPERIVKMNLLKIPDTTSFKEASLVEPLSCVIHGIDESNIKLGDIVVVNGAGPIGLMFIRLAKLKGARVISTDLKDERLDSAKKMGADELINASNVPDIVEAVINLTKEKRGVDVAIEAAGIPELWEKTICMARKGGLVNLFGGCAPGTKITINTKMFHYQELTVKGVYHHTPHYVEKALDLISQNVVGADILISHEFPLTKINEVLKMLVDNTGIKIAVVN